MCIERIKLSDIAGYEQEKKEAIKIIDILKNPGSYNEKGATIPKGLLLSGDPGVGKTLLAKAIASEANVPLFEYESTEAEKDEEKETSIRSLFKQAKKKMPSIILLDELDELVTLDGGPFASYQSDYSRKALKALLTEIDGLESSEGVLVIATTNAKALIPDSLLRSGRLERQISFTLPTLEERIEIAKLYLDKAKVSSIDPISLAEKTSGFTGADFKRLVNEGLIESVQRNEELSLGILLEIIPSIRFGEIRKPNKEGPKDPVCYHEIGHFLVKYGLTGEIGAISVEKLGNIEGRVEFEESYCSFGKQEESPVLSAEDLLHQVSVALGGIAAEDIFLGKRYCGSSSDLSSAVNAIYALLSNGALGFEYIFPLNLNGRAIGRLQPIETIGNYGSDSQKIIIIETLQKSFDEAKEIILRYESLGRALFLLLKEKGCLSKEEILSMMSD